MFVSFHTYTHTYTHTHMQICVYTCIYIHVCVYWRLCVWEREEERDIESGCLRVYIMYMYTCPFPNTHTHKHIFTCTHIHFCTHTHTHTHTHICVCVRVHVWIHVYMCVYMCTCVYMCVRVVACVFACVGISKRERERERDSVLTPSFESLGTSGVCAWRGGGRACVRVYGWGREKDRECVCTYRWKTERVCVLTDGWHTHSLLTDGWHTHSLLTDGWQGLGKGIWGGVSLSVCAGLGELLLAAPRVAAPSTSARSDDYRCEWLHMWVSYIVSYITIHVSDYTCEGIYMWASCRCHVSLWHIQCHVSLCIHDCVSVIYSVMYHYASMTIHVSGI